MQYVYVVGSNGKPLMPCSPAKARKLLKSKSAAVLQRTPFTIKLLHHVGGYKQPISKAAFPLGRAAFFVVLTSSP